MTLPVLAFFAGSLLTALWIAHRDPRRDADLHDLDAYRKAREALAPVVQLAPRQRGQSSLEFLLGWSSGSSYWAQDRPTLTSRSSLRDVSDIEQTFTHPPRANAEGSKHRAVPQRGLSALPRTTGRGRADLLHRDTTPHPVPGRRRI